MVVVARDSCDQARKRISLRLDEQLSELEERLLDAHLTDCAACRSFERDVTGVTQELRSARLEPLARPVETPRRRHAPLPSVRLASAAAVALLAFGAAIGMSVTLSPHRSTPKGRPGPPVSYYELNLMRHPPEMRPVASVLHVI